MEPATPKVLGIGHGVGPVAAEQAGAAKTQLAGLAVGHLDIVLVHQLDLAKRVLLLGQALGQLTDGDAAPAGRRAAGFGRAKGVAERRPVQRGDAGNLRGGYQVGHAAYRPGALGLGAAAVQFVDHPVDHAGHQGEVADELPGGDRHQLRYIQPVHHDHLAAVHQRGKDCVGGHHVKQRRPGNEGIARLRTQVDAGDHRARHHRPLADQGALGQAGGAAGVEDDQAAFGVDVVGRGPAVCCQAWVGLKQRFVLGVEVDQLRHAVRNALHRVGLALRKHQQPGRDQLHAVFKLAVGLAPVLAGQHHAQPGGGHFKLNVLGPVFRQDGNTVAGLQAQAGQPGRQATHPVIKLAVGPALLAKHQRRSVGMAGHLLLKQAVEGELGGAAGQRWRGGRGHRRYTAGPAGQRGAGAGEGQITVATALGWRARRIGRYWRRRPCKGWRRSG